MTTITIFEDRIYADRRVLHYGRPLKFTEGGKIIVSANKQMAYATSGDLITDDVRPAFEETIQAGLSVVLSDVPLPDDLAERITKLNANHGTLILTRDHAVLINPTAGIGKIDRGHLRFLSREYPTSIGSGGDYLMGALEITQSIDAAYAAAAELDIYTSAHYDSVAAADLGELEIWDVSERGK